MKDLKIKLWNDDELTIPFVDGRYKPRAVMNHVKMLLKSVEQTSEREDRYEV